MICITKIVKGIYGFENSFYYVKILLNYIEFSIKGVQIAGKLML